MDGFYSTFEDCTQNEDQVDDLSESGLTIVDNMLSVGNGETEESARIAELLGEDATEGAGGSTDGEVPNLREGLELTSASLVRKQVTAAGAKKVVQVTSLYPKAVYEAYQKRAEQIKALAGKLEKIDVCHLHAYNMRLLTARSRACEIKFDVWGRPYAEEPGRSKAKRAA